MTVITTQETLIRCAGLAQEKKARNVRALDVRKTASFTDYFLICSGTSDRQVITIADHIEETLRKEGIRPFVVEGRREGRWVLLDYADFVVHVFQDEVREFYKFDRLWGSATEIPVPEGPIAET
ncbi:MAG: ribosome silencing factor [Deltaproteobacteria bacterium]